MSKVGMVAEDEAEQEDLDYNKLRHFTEKSIATHSSILAWKIRWVEEPDRLQSMGSLRVGQD